MSAPIAVSLKYINFISIFSASVKVTETTPGPVLGQRYTLLCNVSGAIDNPYSYQWIKDNIFLNESEQFLSYGQLTLSDSGKYTCVVTDGSKNKYESSIDITLQCK